MGKKEKEGRRGFDVAVSGVVQLYLCCYQFKCQIGLCLTYPCATSKNNISIGSVVSAWLTLVTIRQTDHAAFVTIGRMLCCICNVMLPDNKLTAAVIVYLL